MLAISAGMRAVCMYAGAIFLQIGARAIGVYAGVVWMLLGRPSCYNYIAIRLITTATGRKQLVV